MHSFKSYISESSDQECGIKYGKILFGELLKKPEKDTKIEQDLTNLLLNYINYNDKNPKFDKALQQLMKCKTYFKKELTPSASGSVYRGLDIPLSSIDLPFKVKTIKEYEEYEITGFKHIETRQHRQGSSMWMAFPGTYVPRTIVESWTDNPNSSFFDKTEMYYISVMWEVPIQKNEFMFDSEYLELIRDSDPLKRMGDFYMGEDEIIRVSPKPIRGLQWVRLEKYNSYWDFPPDLTLQMGFKTSGTEDAGSKEFTSYEQGGKLIVRIT